LTFLIFLGFINAVAILAAPTGGGPVTHVTGPSSRVAIQLVEGNYIEFAFSLMTLVGFSFGGVLSGVMVGNIQFRLKKSYGSVLLLESVLLVVSAVVLDVFKETQYTRWVWILVAVAAGMQNAICTSFSGAVVRTTHVTGIATDIGLILGFAFRYRWIHKKEYSDHWKLLVFVPIWVCFIAGGIIATVIRAAMGQNLKHYSLTIPAVTMGIFSILYLTVIYRRAPKDDGSHKLLARRTITPMGAVGDNSYKAPLLPQEEGVRLDEDPDLPSLDPATNHIVLEDHDHDE
jgi:uncharacterized membrane protein YoaK (UPF0700 family)